MSTGFNRRDFSKAAVGGRGRGCRFDAGPGPGGRRRRPDPSWLHRGGQPRLPASQGLPCPSRCEDCRALRCLCSVPERRIRQGRSAVRQPGATHSSHARTSRRCGSGQGLPDRAGPAGHRRGRDHHTRPLARHPDDRRVQGRQGCVRREALIDHDRGGARHGRGGTPARAHRPGRHS